MCSLLMKIAIIKLISMLALIHYKVNVPNKIGKKPQLLINIFVFLQLIAKQMTNVKFNLQLANILAM